MLKLKIITYCSAIEKNWYQLQRHDDREERKQNHRQEAVAENADDAADSHAWHAHQVEQSVHGNASDNTDPVDVSKMHFAWLKKHRKHWAFSRNNRRNVQRKYVTEKYIHWTV